MLYQLGAGLGLGAAFLLVWVNAAVGILGSVSHPANLLYFAVLAIAALGAVVARFRASGMARALGAAASAQICITGAALAGGLGSLDGGPWEILGLNGFFIVLFLMSALLFRSAAMEEPIKE